jgi:ubiquitin-protein ligase
MAQSTNMKLIVKNFYEAKRDGIEEGSFDIVQAYENNFEHYYILIKPNVGMYKNQIHIIEMRLKYTCNKMCREYNYPFTAPYMQFITKIFHVNIAVTGIICLDMLKDANKWVPTNSFSTIIRNIILLYDSSNTSSPFNCDASTLFTKCSKVYKNIIKNNKLSIIEEEEIHDNCFMEFMIKSNEYYKQNNLKKYIKYFPQIDSGNPDLIALDELKEIYNSIYCKPKVIKIDKDAEDNAKKSKVKKKSYAKYQKK